MTGRKPLSIVVAEDLAQAIRSGALAPGSQLRTEADLCRRYDVSRTVIREAIARLRSDGMVVSQQGRGMFVSEAPAPHSFSISDEALRSLPETIALLELRLSVETEAAGLCAERRSEEEIDAIRALMEQTDARHDDPTAVHIHYDYDFHLAIAKATRNAFVFGFLGYLRPMIVPRFRLGHIVSAELKEAYYARIHAEHAAIVTAIAQRHGDQARRAMRLHLANSLERVRALALATGVDELSPDQIRAAHALFAEMAGPFAAR